MKISGWMGALIAAGLAIGFAGIASVVFLLVKDLIDWMDCRNHADRLAEVDD